MIKGEGEFQIEHLIFHYLARGPSRQHLQHLYLAIQTGLHFGLEHIDVGEFLVGVFPEGWRYPGPYCPPYSGACLAHFAYLYDITWESATMGDYMHVHWTRRYDGKSITAYMKIHGGSASHEDFIAAKRRLDRKREKILVETRWTDNPFGGPET